VNPGTKQSYYLANSLVLGKGIGQTFDMVDALHSIDNKLAYDRADRKYYERPNPAYRFLLKVPFAPPPFHLKGMTPVATMTPFVLLVIGMVATLPILSVWFRERNQSTKQKSVKLVRRRWMFLVFGIMFLCWFIAAAYIAIVTCRAVPQLNLDTTHINTHGIKASFGGKFQALLAGAIMCQVVSMTSYEAHCWIEKQIMERRVREAEGDVIEDVEPPAYVVEMMDLARIRATEEHDSERRQRGENEV